ncbi:MAG: hypothetical protein KAR06_00695 [Deltaproteobacteria bacterium]|nr:hypothetical protein [Deltaproteobacteria bacterium]
MTEHDTLLTSIIEFTSSRVEAFLNRRLTSTAYTQYFNGGRKKYFLDAFPVASSPAPVVTVYGTVKTLDSDYYLWDDLGMIEFLYDISSTTPKCVKIEWTGGYVADATTGVLDAPDALKQACLMQSVFLFRRRDSLGVNSVTMPDGAIQMNAPTALLKEVREILSLYRMSPGEY